MQTRSRSPGKQLPPSVNEIGRGMLRRNSSKVAGLRASHIMFVVHPHAYARLSLHIPTHAYVCVHTHI